MELSKVAPGVAVTLHTPMKPVSPSWSLIHAVESGEMMMGIEMHHWQGFTHGIILYTEDDKRMFYLLLYDPDHAVFYCDETRNIPVRTLFHYDEVDFLHDPGDFEL